MVEKQVVQNMEPRGYKGFLHYSLILSKLSKALSKQGKEYKVFNHIQRALMLHKFTAMQNPTITLLRLERKVRVLFSLKVIKQGRQSYKVPVILAPFKQLLRFVKVFVTILNMNTKKVSLTHKLFTEFSSIHNGTSSILSYSQTMHQEAFSNRGFAHYR